MHPIFISKNKFLILILLLIISSFHSFKLSAREKHKRKAVVAEDTAPYKIVQDTVINNATVETHHYFL